MENNKKVKYRPYANAEEFLKAQKEHGLYFKYKEGNKNWFLPDIIDDEGCNIGVSKWKDNHVSSVSYSWICDKFKWQGGAPYWILPSGQTTYDYEEWRKADNEYWKNR